MHAHKMTTEDKAIRRRIALEAQGVYLDAHLADCSVMRHLSEIGPRDEDWVKVTRAFGGLSFADLREAGLVE